MIDWIKFYSWIFLVNVKDRFWRTLRGCGIKHNYEMYPPHADFDGVVLVEFKCSRCGDWYQQLQGWKPEIGKP